MDEIEIIDKQIEELKDKIWKLQLKKRRYNNEGKFGTPGLIHKGNGGWYGKTK